MRTWHIRDFDAADLDDAVRVWSDSANASHPPVFVVAEVIEALNGGAPAVVAVAGEHVVGTCVARVTGERAWVLRIAIDPGWRGRGIGSALLRGLEERLLRMGVRRIAALLPEGTGVGHEAFLHQGYVLTHGIEYFEKRERLRPADVGVLGSVGGRLIDPSAWDDQAGMEETKALIERRIVLPLAEPELAARHGVAPPKAVILFGPPGTGKTTFAKGVAGKLGWPFVELFPSRLAAEGAGGRAHALREFFDLVYDVEDLVLFIDEVDEIAGLRSARPDTEGVTNELLKAIPTFRGRDDRLLVCATNSVRDLDPALLRPGALRLRAADRPARRGRAPRALAPLRRGHHARAGRRGGAGGRHRAVHAGRHRVRGAQGGPGGLRAGPGGRRRLAGRGRGLPGGRGGDPPHAHASLVREFEEDIERFARL